MKLITWNIQWCRGVDGKVDPVRIVSEARRLADFDVLCVQEVADDFVDPDLAGAVGENQFESLSSLLPGFTAISGFGIDQPARDGRRRYFGNMIFSRLPVRQIYRHTLPYPCDPGVPGMPRIAIEAVIAAPFGGLRVITTHLEYYSPPQRMTQVDALRLAYSDGHAHARDGRVTTNDGGPFQTFVRPRATLIAGDFNFEPGSPEYQRMLASFNDATPPLFDAWKIAHPGMAHPTTFCLYEKTESGAELHCDFIFVSDELRSRVKAVAVDQQTQASDHQPVALTLDCY